MSENLKRTVLGVVSAIAAIAVTLGWLTPEDSITANEAVTNLLENIGGAILAVGALWGIFTKGSDDPPVAE
jgi:hypothetical protein